MARQEWRVNGKEKGLEGKMKIGKEGRMEQWERKSGGRNKRDRFMLKLGHANRDEVQEDKSMLRNLLQIRGECSESIVKPL